MSPNWKKSIQNGFRDAALSVAGSLIVLMVQINSWGQACVHRGNLLKADRVQEGERELYSLWAVTGRFLILFIWWNILSPSEQRLTLLWYITSGKCHYYYRVHYALPNAYSLILKWPFPSCSVIIYKDTVVWPTHTPTRLQSNAFFD